MILAMGKDIRVVLIKLADRLHNMRTLKFQKEERRVAIARETLDIYAPIAQRLGISKIKIELDDLSLKYLEPEAYYDLVEKIALKKSARDDYIQKLVEEVRSHITNAGIEAEIDGRALTEPVTPLGYILLANPIREAANETFQYFAEQGVEVKVISGDNPVTVSKVAKTAGIKNAENYVDASSLETEEDIKKAILEKTVFGRVTPNQKRQFVQALKEAGKTVAMTGDGVNDVLALKDADCSIAMASGSEAAAQALSLIHISEPTRRS